MNRDVVSGGIAESQTLNRYAFVNGNPISYNDPFGLAREAIGDTKASFMGMLHVGLDVVGLVPVIGEVADGINALAYLSEGDYTNASLSGLAMIPIVGNAATGAKYAGRVADLGKKGYNKISDSGKSILPTEGNVGTYKDLIKRGSAFDNITPHHMPSAAKMKQSGVKRNDGISMNMEQPHPGVGGRHRSTQTYGLSGDKLDSYLGLNYRDALAHDIMDARKIYKNEGLYTSEIREGLLNTIKENKKAYPEIFKK